VLDTTINKPTDLDDVFDCYFLLTNKITEPSKLIVCTPDVIGEQELLLDLQNFISTQDKSVNRLGC
jgi:hypothetical protein